MFVLFSSCVFVGVLGVVDFVDDVDDVDFF